jgi:hypothetical protein
MLSGNPAARVLFFHVAPKLRDFCEINFDSQAGSSVGSRVAAGDRRCMDNFFATALAKLREAGLSESQVETQTAETIASVGDAILKAVRDARVGIVVMGRRGLNKSFFGGSVSHAVSRKLADAALWLVP